MNTCLNSKFSLDNMIKGSAKGGQWEKTLSKQVNLSLPRDLKFSIYEASEYWTISLLW